MKEQKSGTISGAPPVRSMVGIALCANQSMMRSIVSRVMISFRFGPAFTWQCTQMRLQSFPTFTCSTSILVWRNDNERADRISEKRFTPLSSDDAENAQRSERY